MSQKLDLKTSGGNYPIVVGKGILTKMESFIENFIPAISKVALVMDGGCAKSNNPLISQLDQWGPAFILPSGENAKSFPVLESLYDFFSEKNLNRSSVVIAVGGGVTGDVTGYAAATFLRGIRFIQVPTTLLAMVDSSVGGKTGINIKSGKNRVGAFHQPIGVFADLGWIDSLPPRELAAGMAEVIKTGLLGDRELWQQLCDAKDLFAIQEQLGDIVLRCCKVKASIVAEDEREEALSGGRALLNLGHTFGHAIEKVAGYGSYLHGEAVSIGLVAAVRLSQAMGWIDGSLKGDLLALLQKVNLPAQLKAPLSVELLEKATGFDKKNRAGKTQWVLVRRPGEAETCDHVDPAIVREVWLKSGAVLG